MESLIQRGATHFAASSMSREPDSKPFLDEMRARYHVLYEGEDELLLELGRPK